VSKNVNNLSLRCHHQYNFEYLLLKGDNNSYKVEDVLNPNGCLLILMLASACQVVILYSTIMELFASCDVLVSSLQLEVKIVKS
jgi:hypothetical protein